MDFPDCKHQTWALTESKETAPTRFGIRFGLLQPVTIFADARDTTWVEPRIDAEITYGEITDDTMARQSGVQATCAVSFTVKIVLPALRSRQATRICGSGRRLRRRAVVKSAANLLAQSWNIIVRGMRREQTP
jgi:hypothetical protein